MGRLTAQVQMYIAIAVVAVIALAVVFLGIMPQFQEAATVGEQILTEQSNLSAAQALLARRQSAKAQSAANEVELMRIANQIPDSPQLPSVIIEMQDVANASGVDLQSISPGDLSIAMDADGQPQEFSVVPVSLVVRGQWVELIDYVGRIAKLERGVRLVDSSYSYVEATEVEPAFVEASVNLEVYVMGAATTIAAPQGESTTPTTETP